MKRTESWFKGLVMKETFVFISRNLDHIEISEVTTLFGGRWTVRETTREVYLPNLKTIDPDKLRVIAEAYSELHETANIMRRNFNEKD
jgi:hypothetical protein